MLIVIVGKSGSGKSTLTEWMEEHWGIPEIKTYTTRPQRKNDNTHFWSTIQEYERAIEKDLILCSTQFGEHYYWTRKDQVQNYPQSIVVDVKGLKEIIESDLDYVSIYVAADEKKRFENLGPCEAKRMERDKGFEVIPPSWVIDANGSIEDMIANLREVMRAII